MQAHRLSLRLEPITVAAIAESLRASVATATDHEIVIETPAHDAWVMGDRPRLEQVITNLVDNAIKYSPQGGTIGVCVEERDEEVVISVSDEGIGIPQDQQRRLFDRFFRAENLSYGGLGLGLYISRDIVERHGGRIWVESEPGQGSTFRFALPRIRGPEFRPPPNVVATGDLH